MSKKYLWLAGAVFCGLFTCVHSVIAVGRPILTIQPGMVTALTAFAGTFDDPDNSYTLDAGSNPLAVVAADVNGDGKMDLICANLDNHLIVYTNDGSGNLVLASTLNVGSGSNPYAVVAADVNGDGKVDLISANNSKNTLSVFTNKGSGIFVLASSPTVGSQPYSVAAADIKGDHKMALICANRAGNTLTVLTNQGNGLFGSNATDTVGIPPFNSGPRCVIAADVNGDGHVDLISANYDGGTLTVLTNNGSGLFGSNATYTVGSAPRCVIAADVNGDGLVDLISANETDGNLTVLTNNGSGRFVLASTPDVGSGPKSVVAADVNGDGYADLISANGGETTLSVLTNDGSGNFTIASSPGVGDTPISVAAADVNGDGAVDLICADYGGNDLTVWLNTPTAHGLISSVAISWPTNNTTGFVLQQNGDLSTTDWVNVSTPPTVTNHQYQVIVAPLVDSQSYRLRHP